MLVSFLDWIRKHKKIIKNVSNQWKALVLSFPIIGGKRRVNM